MRVLQYILILSVFFGSCSPVDIIEERPLTMNELLHKYDVWFVNVEKTGGNTRIPFLQKAFTLTFDGRNLLANNNLVGLGEVGNGYGDHIAHFYTDDPFLRIHHASGSFRFRVTQVSDNQIDLYDTRSDAIYRLEGHHRRNFDYDRLFYDNIDYFLQEYGSWRKESTNGGNHNVFDDENSLQFYSLDGDFVFESKGVQFYRGLYKVENTSRLNIKLLTLDYGRGNGVEQFELRILSDNRIELYHLRSNTTYTFVGIDNIIYKKPAIN